MSTPITDFEIVNNESLYPFEELDKEHQKNCDRLKDYIDGYFDALKRTDDYGENAFNNTNGNS